MNIFGYTILPTQKLKVLEAELDLAKRAKADAVEAADLERFMHNGAKRALRLATGEANKLRGERDALAKKCGDYESGRREMARAIQIVRKAVSIRRVSL